MPCGRFGGGGGGGHVPLLPPLGSGTGGIRSLVALSSAQLLSLLRVQLPDPPLNIN